MPPYEPPRSVRPRAITRSPPCNYRRLGRPASVRAKNSRCGILSTLHTRAKAPYKAGLRWKTLSALKRPGQSRAVPPQQQALASGTSTGLEPSIASVASRSRLAVGRKLSFLQAGLLVI